MNEFLSIDELSEYLNMKRSTLYALVESGELPHYRIGRLIRFKWDEVVQWMESHRRQGAHGDRKARDILKAVSRSRADIDGLVKKGIAQVKGVKYNPSPGNQVESSTQKGGDHGLV